MVVAKESKISELRQQWIDGLRSDVAKLVSLALQIATVSTAQELRDANECIMRIQLRLNMKEQESIDLNTALNSLQNHAKLNNDTLLKNQTLQALANDVIHKTQVILKNEWKRVKRGEWRYIVVLIIASISLLFSIGLLLYRWLHG